MKTDTKLLVKILAKSRVHSHHLSEIVAKLISLQPDSDQPETEYHNVKGTGEDLGAIYEEEILKEIDTDDKQ